MDLINDVKNQIRQGYDTFVKLCKVTIKTIHLLFSATLGLKDAVSYFNKNRPGEKSKNYFKNDTRGVDSLPNLSKEDLKELKKLSKEYNFQYNIVDEETGKKRSKFSKKEVANYKVVYSAKDSQIIAHAVKELMKRRMERQMKKDPKDRTDFNKDGVTDEKDFDIDPQETKEDGFEYGKEYGTNDFDTFKEEKLFTIEIEKDVFIEKQSVFVNTFANYSAQFLKNGQGKDCFYVTMNINHKKDFEKLVKFGHFQENDFIRMEMNYDGLSKDADECNLIQMNKKEYADFLKKYKGIPYTSYEIRNKKNEKEYMVTFNIKDAKKTYESDKDLKSFSDIEKPIFQKEKDKDVSFKKDIDLDVDLEKE